MKFSLVASKQPIPILTYHQITKAPPRGTPFRSLCVSPFAFSLQMKMLKLLGYQGLSMENIIPYLKGEKVGKVVGITFDDGYRNNIEYALPVLTEMRFTSTCYVVSEQIGGVNCWDNEKGIPSAPLMSEADLLQWVNSGQEVGAHTGNHVHLTNIDQDLALIEVSQSKLKLETIVGKPVNHFCYPYGDFDNDTINLVRGAKYETATTTQRGRIKAGDQFLALPRVPVARTTTLPALWWKLVSSYEERKNSGK